MNAPATLAQVRPAAAARAEDLVSLELIRTLVGFDTTSRDSNLALIDWVRDYLRGHGVDIDADVRRRPAQGQPLRDAAGRDGNATHGGIVLSGHTDVVPVDGQPWDTDPWQRHAERTTACTAAASAT